MACFLAFYQVEEKYVPDRGSVDRIGITAGVAFDQRECRLTTQMIEDADLGRRTIWVGQATT